MTIKKFFGAGFKFSIAAVVIAFLGLRSLDFFYFVTPPDQFYYAYLGFGLTGGAVIGYLIIFLWDADTELKRAISIAMLAFCIIGELATAGFGLQINAWRAAGYQMTPENFRAMILVIQLLGFVHAAALVGYVAGDPIMQAFGDHDGDGIPNYRDPDYKPAAQPKRPLLRLPWQKQQPAAAVQAPAAPVQTSAEPVRQFNLSSDDVRAIAAEVAAIMAEGQGRANGNGRVVDPTSQPRR